MVVRKLPRRIVAAALATFTLFAVPTPARAQQVDEAAVEELQRKLDELLRQAESLRAEIEKLKAQSPAPAAPEDLTAVDALPASAPEEIQPVESSVAPGAAKIFNPDISVIGTANGHAGDSNAFEYGAGEARPPLELGEVEMALEAYVDPYAKGRFFLSVGEEGIEVEEAYAEFVTLPWDLSAKAGKKKALFGKANTWHTHVRPWVDQPLVLHNFFGDEGLADAGVSLSRIIPSELFFAELTAEVMSGSAEGVFERQNRNDLFYNAHLRLFRDLTESSNIEVGTSWARGTAEESGSTSQFAGIDVSYRWKPLQRALYRGLIGRVELMLNDRDDLEKRLAGFYASAEWKLARRWIVGARIDRADRAWAFDEGPRSSVRFVDRGASVLLTFLPSEFSHVRTQLRRISYGGERSSNEVLLQLQFAIGAHGAHTF